MIRTIFAGMALLVYSSVHAQAPQLITQPYVSGLVKPVYITHANDSRLFLVEQDGRIRIVRNDTLLPTPFLDINPQVLSTGNEQGLLGLAFHPDYKTNGFFYVNYINNSGNTCISRFQVNPADSNAAMVSSELVLMTVTQPYTNHNGGNLLFGNDGYLYIFFGDGGNANDPQNRSQNPRERLGKTLRIDVNHGNLFAIPPDNPFINDTNYLPEIWNLGLRNPWKGSFDAINGDLWMGDVGQNIWEEIDYQSAGSTGGENYGWRCYEASVPFNLTGCQSVSTYTMPIHEYDHVNGNCSVTGGEVYRGSKYANLFGHYIFADFCVPQFRTIRKNGNQFNYATNSTWPLAGISCFGHDFRGELYAANLYNGEVRKLVDTSSCIPVAWLSDEDTIQVCGNSVKLSTPFGDSLSYAWTFNGAQIPGATGNEYVATQGGTYIVSVNGSFGVCRNADTVVVVLNGTQPNLSITGLDTSYCTNQSAATLTGTPSGGTFFGLGVNGNTFSPALAGTGTILIQYNYTTNLGCTFKKILATSVRSCSGISQAESAIIQVLYPNPANEQLMVKIRKEENTTYSFSIADAIGREISSATQIIPGENTDFTLNTASFAQGTYILRIMNSKGESTTRLFHVIH